MEAPQARKSIGAQVYYGVRLDGDADADKFLDDLAGCCVSKPCFCPLSSLLFHSQYMGVLLETHGPGHV